MGKKSSDPADVAGAARVEAAASKEAAIGEMFANRPDQFNYLGGVQWTPSYQTDPITGQTVTRWTQEQSLSPMAQSVVDPMMQQFGDRATMANALSGRIYDEMSAAPDFDQFGQAQTGPTFGGYVDGPTRGDYQDAAVRGDYQDAAVRGDYRDFNFDDSKRKEIEDAYYTKAQSRLDPEFAKEAQQMEVNLRSKGLRPGDQVYDSTMANYNTGKNDAYEQARLNSILEGGVESDRQYEQQFGTVDYFNKLVDQTYNQDVAAVNRLDAQTDQIYNQDVAAVDRLDAQTDQTYNQAVEATNTANLLRDQTYGYGVDETERANAARDAAIQEYIGKRGFSLAEQDSLSSLNDLNTLAGLITGQGLGGKTDSGSD